MSPFKSFSRGKESLEIKSSLKYFRDAHNHSFKKIFFTIWAAPPTPFYATSEQVKLPVKEHVVP